MNGGMRSGNKKQALRGNVWVISTR
jgi:hypothetical protein